MHIISHNLWGTKRPYLEHKLVKYTVYKSIRLQNKFVDSIRDKFVFLQIYIISALNISFIFTYYNSFNLHLKYNSLNSMMYTIHEKGIDHFKFYSSYICLIIIRYVNILEYIIVQFFMHELLIQNICNFHLTFELILNVIKMYIFVLRYLHFSKSKQLCVRMIFFHFLFQAQKVINSDLFHKF